jgi:catechol 1,2-dioxygenase
LIGAGSALLVPACAARAQSGGGERGGGQATGALACAPTEADIEGPYDRPGAPLRSDLTTPDLDGERLVLRGVVRTAAMRTTECEPLAGALLDVWQADAAGHYDNDGSRAHDPRALILRGRVRTDASGRYELRTIVPGRYRNGDTYRPAHIHVKVIAQDRPPLTTQLYFPGDPFSASDPFFGEARVVAIERDRGALAAAFDFALPAAAPRDRR